MRLIADEKGADVDGQLAGFVGAEVVQLFLEACGVRGEIAEGDGRIADAAWTGVDLEVEILLDVGVEIELALLDELHHRDVGEELGDRAGTEGGDDRIDGCLLLEVGVTVASQDKRLAVLVDGDGRAGDVIALQLKREEAVEKGGDILRGELWRGLRVRWWEGDWLRCAGGLRARKLRDLGLRGGDEKNAKAQRDDRTQQTHAGSARVRLRLRVSSAEPHFGVRFSGARCDRYL